MAQQLSAPIKQHDVVYGQLGVADNAPGSIWLRIRTENDAKTIFTLKQQYDGGLDSIEHETEVSNADEQKYFDLAKKTLKWATKITEEKNSLFK